MSSNAPDPGLQSRMQMAKDMKEEDKLYRYNGVLYPRIMCPEEHLKGLNDFKGREDDVMLVAYPKCGEQLRSFTTFIKWADAVQTELYLYKWLIMLLWGHVNVWSVVTSDLWPPAACDVNDCNAGESEASLNVGYYRQAANASNAKVKYDKNEEKLLNIAVTH